MIWLSLNGLTSDLMAGFPPDRIVTWLKTHDKLHGRFCFIHFCYPLLLIVGGPEKIHAKTGKLLVALGI